jgi:hypothetical protein
MDVPLISPIAVNLSNPIHPCRSVRRDAKAPPSPHLS